MHQITLTIDVRAQQNNSALQTSSVELIPQLEGLLPTELSALEHAISDDLLSHQGWTVDAQGRVKIKGMQLYKAGYVTVIKKIYAIFKQEGFEVKLKTDKPYIPQDILLKIEELKSILDKQMNFMKKS